MLNSSSIPAWSDICSLDLSRIVHNRLKWHYIRHLWRGGLRSHDQRLDSPTSMSLHNAWNVCTLIGWGIFTFLVQPNCHKFLANHKIPLRPLYLFKPTYQPRKSVSLPLPKEEDKTTRMLAIVSFCFLPRALEYFHEKTIHQTPHRLMKSLTLKLLIKILSRVEPRWRLWHMTQCYFVHF